MEKITVTDVRQALEQYYDVEKAEVLPRFFKTGRGEYGEGDVFIGVAVPNVRKVAKLLCKDASLDLMEKLLESPLHECRSCALFMLSERFVKTKDEELRKSIFDFYLAHAHRVNNWDLVDCSAHIIVGGYLRDKPRDVLYRLMDDPLLWNKRISVVATWHFIRYQKEYEDTFRLTEKLLAQDAKPHDLMQKACGWMLREVGKRNMDTLQTFLEKHVATMPRTMLRYAIERMEPAERAYFMNRKK